MHAYAFGRPCDVAARLFEAAFKIGSFELASCFTEVRQIGQPRSSLPPAVVPLVLAGEASTESRCDAAPVEISRLKRPARRENGAALDSVAQLAHIARPTVVCQVSHGFRTDSHTLELVFLRVCLKKMLGQERDVLSALAQRRQSISTTRSL